MFEFTRREWILRSLSLAGAAFAAQLPPQFSTPAPPPCDPSTKPTPARRPLPPVSGAAGRALTLEGAVIGIRCGLIAGANVVIAAGNSRAAVTTDANGRYRATITLPKTGGVSRVNLQVDVPAKAAGAKPAALVTYLFLPDEIARAENAKAAGFDPLLRMKLIAQTPDAIHASFDVIFDL